MRRLRFILALAWRESRASRRRLLLFASAISLGVGALVAIGSFTENLEKGVRSQARQLLGADLELGSSRPFSRNVQAVLDSLTRAGARVARRTGFSSMAYVRRTEGIRLVDVRAVDPGFPFYGDVVTSPAGRWPALDTARVAIVDTSLLVALSARIGDTLEIGNAQFPIAGVVSEVPGHVTGGFNAFGTQVYIPFRDVPATRLIVFGSRVRHSALIKFLDPRDARRLINRERPLFDRERVARQTAEDTQREITGVLDDLSTFLQFVGLIALLLGGIGVASGVGAFVAGKIDTVAVLRCLGASRPLVFAVYLTQAAALGLIAATAGAGLGVATQLVLPRLLRGLLPADVRFTLEPDVILGGIGIGVAVAVLFALRPLLEVRLVSPLQALRRAFETAPARTARDPWRLVAAGALASGVLALCMYRNEDPAVGLGFAVAIGLSVGILALAARLAVAGARRLTRGPHARVRWPYVVRQGLANLHRPRNQTRSVVIALGFGVGLLAALYLIQANLMRFVRTSTAAVQGRPNLVFIDIQRDQEQGVTGLVRSAGAPVLQVVPIVPMRISAVNGRPKEDLLRDTSRAAPRSWTLRREYRSTYRDSSVSSERLVGGAWWHGRGEAASGMPYPVSVSTDLATDLKVGIGDAITWDVSGVTVETRVVALREVDWARFETNFFAVFSTAALERAPRSYVVLTRVDDAGTRARLQRAVSERFPNVTSFDVALLQRTVERILARVALAIRFMAALSLGTGALVLLGAVAAGRLERIREGALLKALGATRRQIERILLAEYVALGALAALVGIVLAIAGGWAFTHYVFELRFTVPAPAMVAVFGATAVLVAVVGMTASREVFRRTAMEVLRDV
ncbi:MAG: ABC transporter permease [Gemmatimonadetes bacterium]|nr:ABC transporter permease [Gemmatimonadota bacterium]